MIVTDPISDMFTRIRNGLQVAHDSVRMPTSKSRVAIAEILRDEGYIDDFRVTEATKDDRNLGGRKILEVDLRYTKDRKRVITGIKRVSKPGLRVYSKSTEIPKVLGGLGIAIISTSSGVMTDRQARKRHVGGEVVGYVW